jgi:hypothetical protein
VSIAAWYVYDHQLRADAVTQLPLRKLAVLVHADIVDSTVLLQANEALSRMPWLFVISRNSSFVHKGQQVDLRKAAGALGVQYVLEGSLRKSGARVRVTAQLIDAMTEKPIRAGKFDRELADVFFALQEESRRLVRSTCSSNRITLRKTSTGACRQETRPR